MAEKCHCGILPQIWAFGGRFMRRGHPGPLYWLCTFVSGVIVGGGLFVAKASGTFDAWTFGGALALAFIVWLAGFLAG